MVYECKSSNHLIHKRSQIIYLSICLIFNRIKNALLEIHCWGIYRARITHYKIKIKFP